MDDMLKYAEEEAAKRRAEALRDEADPAHQARAAARRKADHERGVRLGWFDEEGNNLLPLDDEEEDEG